MGYTTSTVHGIDVPNSAEANNVPEDLGKIVDVLETGSLVKRLTSTQIGALTNAQKPAGLVVYNTTTNKLQVSNGSTFADVDTTPVGVVNPYAGSTAPDGWLLCYGQAVSRSTYAALFAVLSTTYGVGDGSTTFNLPDLRGRVAAGVDNMGGSAASRITSATSGITGTTLGAAGGDQRLHAHSHGVTDPGHTHTHNRALNAGSSTVNFQQGTNTQGTTTSSSSTTGISIDNNTQGGGAQNVQPTMMLNYIIRAV